MALEAVVVGASAGGPSALRRLLGALAPGFPAAVIVVNHLADDGTRGLAEFLVRTIGAVCALPVEVAQEREFAMPGTVHIAPDGYHLLLERDRRFSLSADEKVLYSRPSIDVLFASAADTYGRSLAGVVLTGASSDGAIGLKLIRKHGGMALVQDPRAAEVSTMPAAALSLAGADLCGRPEDLAHRLNMMARR